MRENKWRQGMATQLEHLVAKGKWNIQGPVRRSRECDLFVALHCNTSERIALKRFHTAVHHAAPRDQYDALCKYQARMTGAGCVARVPRVYGYLAEQRVLVMEWLAGKSLASSLFRSMLSPKLRGDLVQQTGAWLRTFHEASGITTDDISYEVYLGKISNHIQKNEREGRAGIPCSSLFDSVYSRLSSEFISDKRGVSIAHAISHGDFTPVNLLVDANDLVGIDIWALQRTPVDLDIARMVVYLTIAYTGFPPVSVYSADGVPCKDLAALAEGYGRDLIEPHSAHFKTVLLTEYLRRWVVIDKRKPTAKNLIPKIYQLRCLKRQVRSIVGALW